MSIISVAYDSPSARRLAEEMPLGFHTFPEIITLDADTRARLQKIGALSVSVLAKVGALLTSIVRGELPEFEWFLPIFLGSVPTDKRSFARELIAAVGKRCPVGFFRADVIGDGQIAELQCPGSGIAYAAALEAHYGRTGANSPLLSALAKQIGDRRTIWWLRESAFEQSVRWLVEECKRAGMNIDVATEETFDPENVEFVIKRPPLPDLISHPKGERILRRWLAGEVEFDTLPTMAVEVKHWLVLLSHPDTKGYFAEEERGLAPSSYWVDSAETHVSFRGGPHPERTVGETFRRNRNAVLKYGGAKRWLRAGCHAVYYLGAAGCKLPERETLLERALADYTVGEAWLLQQYKPAFWPHPNDQYAASGRKLPPYYAIYRPHYRVSSTGQAELVSTALNTRSDWKVHGRSDAYFGLCD